MVSTKKRSEFAVVKENGKRVVIGIPVKLLVNHYTVNLPKNTSLYHYDVEIKDAEAPVQAITQQLQNVQLQPQAGRGGRGGRGGGARGGGRGGGAAGAGARAAPDRPRLIPRRVKRDVMEAFQFQNKVFFTNESKTRIFGVFDGEKNFYTAQALPGIPNESVERTVTLSAKPAEGERERSFSVEMKFIRTLPVQALHEAIDGRGGSQSSFPEDTLAAFQIALREALSRWSPAPGSTRTFFFPQNSFGLGENICWKRVWPRIFMSLRPNMWKYTVNLDISHSVFSVEKPMTEFYDYFMYDRFNIDLFKPGNNNLVQERHKQAARTELYNLKVRTTHSGVRDYRITGFSNLPLANVMFTNSDNVQQRIVDYFRATYPTIKLEKLQYPAVQSGFGSTIKYLPMELCTLKGGQKMGVKLSEKEQADMVKACAKPAYERRKIIEDIRSNRVPVPGQAVGKLPFDAPDNPYAAAFGVEVGKRMLEINGRILPSPPIQGSKLVSYNKDQGAYDNWKDPFLPLVRKPPKVWFIIRLSEDRRINMEQFIQRLVAIGKTFFGGDFPPPFNAADAATKTIPQHEFEKYYNQLKQRCGKKPDLLMVIISRKNGPDYADWKQFGDIREGIVTQMIAGDTLARNLTKGIDTYCSNVMLKINAKLNGTNQIVAMPQLPPGIVKLPGVKKLLAAPIIVFGADVTHPSPGGGGPSIAAVTASMDRYFALYSARVRSQKSRVEEIVDMKGMIKELLIEYRRRNNGAKPQRLLFFRDGVSEGQYETVGINELAAIQTACKQLEEGYKPGITYLIVGKRHHTRMFPTSDRDASGRAGNVKPGTIIDSDICHFSALDYYLCSHYGLQGTSRPAHYHVLFDDNDLDIDSVEVFSFYLCFVYQRCLRAVSLPAPTYYAHHVAFRARHHLARSNVGGGGGDSRSVMSAVSDISDSELKKYDEAILLHGDVLNTQYFC